MILSLVLTSCGSTKSQTAEGMIDPGDKLGDILVTTGDEKDVDYLMELDCVEQDDQNMTCDVNTGKKVNVSYAVYNDGRVPGSTLDSLWSEHTYMMLIGDQQVNLEAFGSIDAYHTNEFGNPFKMRHWNVWIVADKPAEVKIQHSGVVGGEPFEGTTTITFVAP